MKLYMNIGCVWLLKKSISSYVCHHLILVVLSVSMASCRGSYETPARPTGVPPSAAWAGGADGGAWIECTVNNQKNSNYCTIYWHNTGEIVSKGHFRLRGVGNAAKEAQLSYEAFDGTSIYLLGNLVLDPVPRSSKGKEP